MSSLASDLMEHMSFHTGEKPAKCFKCYCCDFKVYQHLKLDHANCCEKIFQKDKYRVEDEYSSLDQCVGILVWI